VGGPLKPGVGLSGAVRSGSLTSRWMCSGMTTYP